MITRTKQAKLPMLKKCGKMNLMPPRKRTPKPSPIYAWRMARGLMLKEAAVIFGVSLSTYRRLELMTKLPKRYDLAFSTIKQSHPV